MKHQEFLGRYHAHEVLTIDDCVDVIEEVFDDLDRLIERLDREEREQHMGAFDKAKEILVPNDDSSELASEEYLKKHPGATAAQEFREKWGWEPHEQITLRGKLTAGMQEEITNASSGVGPDNKFALQSGSGRNVMLEQMIVRWTLARNGNVVDINIDTIRELPTEYTVPLFEICDKLAMRVMDAKQQKDFLASANGHTKTRLDVVK